ncbi:MAG: UDP-N-acetylenolpyruvoylglucosamine reductase [Candidatus Omnitrophica bacterium 4484_171]|nr:MAG: UDP-N-acetylenolpyruvoylglucosamine reductase [Candidatus Omnitrophica bacterium 4484_171]
MDVRTHKPDVRKKVSLKIFNTLRLEAIAPIMFVAHSTDDLSEFAKRVCSWDDFYLLGAGSNIFIENDILNKPVLILGKEFSYIERVDSLSLEIGAATALSKVISYTIEQNLRGLEELAGIPASIGGMMACNASSFGKELLSLVEEAAVIDESGEIKHVKKSDIRYSYRRSSLENCIIIKAILRFDEACDVREKVISYLGKRLDMQDFSYPSAGCIFKNPLNVSAGYLIDKCGLKGFRVGGAQVSLKHGNFIINRADAKAGDINYIIAVIKERVNERFGIILEEEIVRWKI